MVGRQQAGEVADGVQLRGRCAKDRQLGLYELLGRLLQVEGRQRRHIGQEPACAREVETAQAQERCGKLTHAALARSNRRARYSRWPSVFAAATRPPSASGSLSKALRATGRTSTGAPPPSSGRRAASSV